MRVLLPLPVVLPLLGAGLSMAAARRRWLQRLIGVTILSITTAVSVAILVQVDRNGPAAAFMGGWEAPVGISLVADRLTGLMLVVASPIWQTTTSSSPLWTMASAAPVASGNWPPTMA